jgi:general secretion pathway protein K
VVRRESEKGIALIAVLWTLTLLSIIAASLSLETRTSARVARNTADNAAARAAADAGIQRAILDLVAQPGTHPNDEKFRADGTVYAWPFANSTVRISIRDEASKLDLNLAPEALLVRLFGSAGIDPGNAQSLADAIVDFRDPDNLRRPVGAEEPEYKDAGLAWGPKNAPFQSIEELQQVLGMTPEIYKRVAPKLTIYSTVGPSDATAAADPPTPDADRAAFYSRSATNPPGVVFSIRAEARGSSGAIFVREAVVQKTPQNVVPYQILAWRRGTNANARGTL